MMMLIKNDLITEHEFLPSMYRDEYFPNFLVDKIKFILLSLCEAIEYKNPTNEEALLELTHEATLNINALEDEFEENDSELETIAREEMAEEFEFVVQSYGFRDLNIEDVIAPREW